jgi:predicted ferric reductase
VSRHAPSSTWSGATGAFRALRLLLIVFLAVVLVVLSLVSMWKENRFGWPLRGIIWFTIAIAGSCAVIALLAGYVQKGRSLEKVTHRVEVVTPDHLPR